MVCTKGLIIRGQGKVWRIWHLRPILSTCGKQRVKCNQVRKGLVGNTEVREKAEVDWTISSHLDILPTWKGQDFFLRMKRG